MKTNLERFAKKCEEMLDIITIEKELNEVNLSFSRAKIEQLDKDIKHVYETLENI